MTALSYLFWPNPGGATYGDPHPQIAIAVCGAFLLLSLALRIMRARSPSGAVRRFAQSFDGIALWFGVTGLLLVIARVEEIQYLAMRFLWIVWGGSFILCGVVRLRRLRLLGYEVIPSAVPPDLREKYLPRRKRSR